MGRNLIWAALAVSIALVGSMPSRVHAAERPNIVFVLFDDMGWGQPRCYDADSALRTPNLDRLAGQGMRFTDAHSAAAVCTPTRYGLLTGRSPWRIGQFGVLTTYSQPIIPPSRLTVARLLKQNGYHTACVGKWHLGMNWIDGKPGNENQVPIGAKMTGGPNDLGFDYFCGFTHARNIGTIIEQDQVVAHVEAEANQPLMIAKALAYLEERVTNNEKFFLYFPMCPPHTPVAPAADYIGKSGATDVVKRDPSYGDWVYQGDDMLGQLMDSLDRHGIAEQTLIIATADNGAAGRAYAPLRASKSSIYEGGHRVPFVARWPGRIEPGSVNRSTICLNGLMATVAELIDAELPDDAGEDSISYLDNLRGIESQAPKESIVHQSPGGDLAIRHEQWKAIFHKNGQRELYDLANDLSETKNLAGDQADVLSDLQSLLQRYSDRGRSTPGAVQTNEQPLSLDSNARQPRNVGEPNRRKSAAPNQPKRASAGGE